MTASKSFNTSRHTERRTSARYESYSARTARLQAAQYEADAELRSALRGTWAELEQSEVDETFIEEPIR